MAGSLPLALQLCSFAPFLEERLADRVTPVRWFEMADGERHAWLAANAANVGIVATGGHVGCPRDLMSALPALRLVAINGVGFDKVDLALARERGVAVSNTPGVLDDDVADIAVGMVIGLLRGLPAADRFVREGRWLAGEMALTRKVTGSKFGILGLGRIGRQIAARLAPFGEVAYSGRTRRGCDLAFFADPVGLARWADVLVVACAATAETRGLVGAAMLEALGPRGYLVNIARGSVVDEPALVRAISDGAIAGAALDVFAAEPHVPTPLIASDRTMLSPHVASGTVETRTAMADLVLANIDACLAGEPLVTPVA